MSIIKLKNVSKFYQNNGNISSGFNRINLELNMGEFVAITGESGSGKSTLLNVISGLDSYEEGEMYINGEETSHYTETDYEIYRRKYIGNIFQSFNLINSYTVYQNIELVLLLNGKNKKEIKPQVLDLIKTVGLTKYKNTKVSKLSGGQKQRVAIARALAKDTPIIVADEPTGNLDVKSAEAIMKLLYEISKNKLVVIVTHNYEQIEPYATRKISMSDGKIIEDKILKPTESFEIEESDYESITFKNKLMLGFRNAFNIKTKFFLLLLVYLILTLTIFSQYSNISKAKYDQESYGHNYNFQDTSVNRVILNKKDKTNFTESDIKNIKKLNNIKNLVENDIILDKNYSLQAGDFYFQGKPRSIDDLTNVDEGELPKKDGELVLELNENNFYARNQGLIGKEVIVRPTDGGEAFTFVISGIKYKPNSSEITLSNLMDEMEFYVTNKSIDKFKKGGNIAYSSLEFKIENKILINGEEEYFVLNYLDKLKKGESYVIQTFMNNCPDYECKDKNLDITVKNIYYEEKINTKIKDVITSENIKKLIGKDSFDEYVNTLFISEEDYNALFDKASYQVSVFLNDTKESDKTLKELNNMGYNTIYMRNIIVDDFETFRKIITIIRSISFIVSSVVLFFISYFVIRIILKSRNIYYSTIRILGSTKKQARDLLNIELLIDINIAYIIFIGIILLAKFNIINYDYVYDVITYFKLIDYILVYVVLVSMSYGISMRYASKLFNTSAMNAYREEN